MRYHVNVKLRLLISVLQIGCTHMIIPFMAIYFAKQFGAAIAGIMLFVAIFGSIVSGMFSGYFSDKYGRKNILIASFLFQFITIVAIAIGLFPGHEIPLLTFLGVIFFDVSAGLQVPPMEAMIIDVTTPETRRSLYSLLYWLSNCAMVIGTFFGAFLHTKHFFILSVISAGVILLLFVLVKFFIKETVTLKEKKEHNVSPFKEAIGSYKYVFKNSAFLKFALAMLMIIGMEMQLPKYISVRLTEQFHSLSLFGFTVSGVEMFGVLKIENAIIIVVITMVVGKLLKKYKVTDRNRMLVGVSLFSIGFVILGFSNNFWVLLLFMGILSFGEVIYVPIENTLLAEIADEENRSKYMAASALSMRMGSILSAVWLSLSAILNASEMSLTFAMMGFVAVLMFFLIYRERTQKDVKRKEEVV